MLRVLFLVYPFKSLVLYFIPQAIITRLPQLFMEEAMIIMGDLRMGTMVATIGDIMVDTVVDTMAETMAVSTMVEIMAVGIGDSWV